MTEISQMMDFDSAFRAARLQELVKWATLEALKEDGHHKSSEGYMEIGYCLPGMFSNNELPYWQVQIYSYVLGPSRMHSWTGATLDAAMALAEAAVKEWTEEYKMKAFTRDMERTIPPEDDIEDQIPPHPADEAHNGGV